MTRSVLLLQCLQSSARGASFVTARLCNLCDRGIILFVNNYEPNKQKIHSNRDTLPYIILLYYALYIIKCQLEILMGQYQSLSTVINFIGNIRKWWTQVAIISNSRQQSKITIQNYYFNIKQDKEKTPKILKLMHLLKQN